jgi:anti-sigma factor RsiW
VSARSCAHVSADLSAYLEGDLDAAAAAAVRAHLDGCAACRSELELTRLSVGALRRLPDLPPPAAILTGVRARLQPQPLQRRLLGARFRQFGVPLSAAATVLVAIGASLLWVRTPERSRQLTEATRLEAPAPQAPAERHPSAPSAPSAPAAPVPAAVAPPPRDGADDKGLAFRRLKQNAGAPAAAEPKRKSLRYEQLGESRGDERLQGALRQEERAAIGGAKDDAIVRDAAVRDEIRAIATAPAPAAAPPPSPAAKAKAEADADAVVGSGEALKKVAAAGAAPQIRLLCRLTGAGETVDEFARVLRQEGADGVEIAPLEAARGWSVTARIQPAAASRLVRLLSNRGCTPGPDEPAGAETGGSPGGQGNVHLTILR